MKILFTDDNIHLEGAPEDTKTVRGLVDQVLVKFMGMS